MVVWTIPNAVSTLRLLLVPLFIWLLVDDRFAAAGWLLLIIGSTDWIDGLLARRLGQVSEVGKILDPLADRLAVVAAVIGGWITGVLNPVFAGLLVLREVLIGIGALVMASRGMTALPVRYVGKLATFLLYGAIVSFYLAAGYDSGVLEALGWVTGLPGLVLYYYALVLYVGDARRALAGGGRVSSSDPEGGAR